MRTVATISVAPVKALGLHHPEAVELTNVGVAGNRQYFLVDEAGPAGRRSPHGPLVRVTLGGRERAADAPVPGRRDRVGRRRARRLRHDRLLGPPGRGPPRRGPVVGCALRLRRQPLRLVRAERDDAWDVEPATLVSLASCARLGDELDAEIDPRRFRMLLTLDGCAAHEEDGWNGRRRPRRRRRAARRRAVRAAPSRPRTRPPAVRSLDTSERSSATAACGPRTASRSTSASTRRSSSRAASASATRSSPCRPDSTTRVTR